MVTDESLQYRPRMSAFVQRWGDLLLAAAIAALVLIQGVVEAGSAAGRLGYVASGLVLFAVLLYRRRFPLVPLAGVTALVIADIWLPDAADSEAYGFVAVLAVYTAAAHTDGLATVVGAALTVTFTAGLMAADGESWNLGGILFFGLLLGSPFVVGRAIRYRRLREAALEETNVALARERDERARAAVAEERTRIARELHDVVAHAVSVMVLQARGGRAMLDSEPAESRQAFDTIERTGRQALGEMRRLLGQLRADDEELALAPQPSLSRLDALADEVSRAGLPVELRIEGEPAELPAGVDVSAFRIVQEALTNALKHAGPARAIVAVRYGDGEVDIEVADDGRGSANGIGGGHGLMGIQERVAIYGGDFAAGASRTGGYAVRARLPYEVER
jgi:signal transduction histidine kinase